MFGSSKREIDKDLQDTDRSPIVLGISLNICARGFV